MAGQRISDEQAQQTIDAMASCGGNLLAASRLLGLAEGTFRHRYQQAKDRDYVPRPTRSSEHPARINLEIEDGCILVAGDAHYWPEIVTTTHKALVRACKEMQPRAIIMNGDIFDGASVSRHQPIGWEKRPSVVLELEACRERLAEIEQAAGKIQKIWPLGNHDARFETRLASVAPEYAKVNGVHLKDHFAFWESCWSCWINDGDVVVKHRLKGGIHATYNNVKTAGTHIVTNHLHQGKATPVTNYKGTFWGIDTGTLCEPPWYQALDYLEDAPVDWRSSFVKLTFRKGRMMQPQFIYLWQPGQVEYQGRVWDV
jgi:hypothetical protein